MCWGGKELGENITTIKLPPFVFFTNSTERHALSAFVISNGVVLLLSQNPLVGLSMGIPNILSLYRSPSFISMAILRATNSEPKVEDSIVFCRLEYQSRI
jgi:hypothetical protein